MSLKLLPEVEQVPSYQIRDYITKRAETIVSNTQGDSWDEAADWIIDAVELAHAVMRLLNEGRIAT